MSNPDLVLMLLLQLALLLAVCQVVGIVGARLGQTQVVSEMVAGVLLGPSLLGVVAPGVQAWLFPAASMPVLYALAQLGLVLYMFLVGLEFNAGLMQGRARGAIAVSAAGMLAPLALGAIVRVALGDATEFFGSRVSVGAGALYLGAALAITAFPILARIIHEKGLTHTRVGTLALAAGGSGDALAWCLLAVVLWQLEGDGVTALRTIGGSAAFVLFMLTIGRRLCGTLGDVVEARGRVTPEILVTTLTIMLLSAWTTDALGIHAVFGAFLAGAVMPRGRLAAELVQHLGAVTTTLFLPVFFVYSGLNTHVGLLATPYLWAVALVVLAVAVAGKGVACLLVARAAGEEWREATALGILMNARGVTELVILTIGLERGIITPTLFTIMVVMAVVTTLMTSPLFDLVYRRGTVHVPARASASAARRGSPRIVRGPSSSGVVRLDRPCDGADTPTHP